MSRFPIEPHFVYTQGHDHIEFPTYNSYHAQGIIPTNANIFNELNIAPAIFRPAIDLPSLGNTHAHRRGNRITVTSIRLKIHINLDKRWAYAFQPNTQPTTASFNPEVRMMATNKRFFKARFMVVQFDDDMIISDDAIAKWFFRSYCYYTSDSRGAVTPWPPVQCTEPVSVHSNILRLTTAYTGKFNILMDKPITLTSRSSDQVFDITVPLNRSYVFDEEDTTKLLFPNIHLFILPPLNFNTDLDPLTRYELLSYYTSTSSADRDEHFDLYEIYYFAKLNFVDL